MIKDGDYAGDAGDWEEDPWKPSREDKINKWHKEKSAREYKDSLDRQHKAHVERTRDELLRQDREINVVRPQKPHINWGQFKQLELPFD